VLIIVTRSLTSSEGIYICRKFIQTFFLAPQESGGYFVLNGVSPQESGIYFVLNDFFFARILNDVFRFITEINQVVIQENEDSQNAKSGLKIG
jgi:hypothetical protein